MELGKIWTLTRGSPTNKRNCEAIHVIGEEFFREIALITPSSDGAPSKVPDKNIPPGESLFMQQDELVCVKVLSSPSASHLRIRDWDIVLSLAVGCLHPTTERVLFGQGQTSCKVDRTPLKSLSVSCSCFARFDFNGHLNSERNDKRRNEGSFLRKSELPKSSKRRRRLCGEKTRRPKERVLNRKTVYRSRWVSEEEVMLSLHLICKAGWRVPFLRGLYTAS